MGTNEGVVEDIVENEIQISSFTRQSTSDDVDAVRRFETLAEDKHEANVVALAQVDNTVVLHCLCLPNSRTVPVIQMGHPIYGVRFLFIFIIFQPRCTTRNMMVEFY